MYLPEELAAEHGISVVPLHINVGDESYLDGVELSRQAFYEKLPEWKTPPQTATPNPGMFRRVYERLVDEGVTEILSIHISIGDARGARHFPKQSGSGWHLDAESFYSRFRDSTPRAASRR